MTYDPQEFQDYYALFELENHAPEWPLYKSPEAVTLLRNRAASYGGLIAISSFIRAFNELRAENKIQNIRSHRPVEPEETELTAQQYHALPAAVVQRRWHTDPDFRQSVQNLMDAGKI
jgi:hypothetical protein